MFVRLLWVLTVLGLVVAFYGLFALAGYQENISLGLLIALPALAISMCSNLFLTIRSRRKIDGGGLGDLG